MLGSILKSVMKATGKHLFKSCTLTEQKEIVPTYFTGLPCYLHLSWLVHEGGLLGSLGSKVVLLYSSLFYH